MHLLRLIKQWLQAPVEKRWAAKPDDEVNVASIRIAYAECDRSPAWSLFSSLDEEGHICGLLPIEKNADHGYVDAEGVAAFTDLQIYYLSSDSEEYNDLLTLLNQDAGFLKHDAAIPIVAISFELLSRPHWLPKSISFVYLSPVERSDHHSYVRRLLARVGLKSPALNRAFTKISNAGIQIFLSYTKADQAAVRRLYNRLDKEHINVWFDHKRLLVGQDWEDTITQALRKSDAVVACLSKNSVRKTGFVQKELAIALDELQKRPEGRIYLLPTRLAKCDLPNRLKHLHVVDLYKKGGFARLVRALEAIADMNDEAWEEKP